jgi:phage tail-like protein
VALFDPPPAAFHFAVSFGGSSEDSSFQEISGLKVRWTTQNVEEGGENRYVHKLPLRTEYSNVILKRGVVVRASPLAEWLTESFSGNFAVRPARAQTVVILLLNDSNQPILKWSLAQAYPVSWDHSNLASMESNLLIETIELSCAYFERSAL